jgi:hypothetical protein
MSRARWLALGSAVALTSCGGMKDPGSTGNQQSGYHGGEGEDAAAEGASSGSGSGGGNEAGTGEDAWPVVVAEASTDDASSGDAGSPEASDYDGSPTCVVPPLAFQCASEVCNAATQYCVMSFGGSQISCEDTDGGGYFPSECTECPTCACVTAHAIGPNCQCIELDAGGIGLQCAGCYGAPPTRLELLDAA